MKEERWLPAYGYEGWYEVSDLGRVRRSARGPHTKPGRMLKPWTQLGYKYVEFCRDGVRQKIRLHVLVLETFVGPRPDGLIACHNNGDKGDARLVNLRWDTHSENTLDAVRHGTYRSFQATKTHCVHGHEYTADNTRVDGRGHRFCGTCSRVRARLAARRRRAQAKAAKQCAE